MSKANIAEKVSIFPKSKTRNNAITGIRDVEVKKRDFLVQTGFFIVFSKKSLKALNDSKKYKPNKIKIEEINSKSIK